MVVHHQTEGEVVVHHQTEGEVVVHHQMLAYPERTAPLSRLPKILSLKVGIGETVKPRVLTGKMSEQPPD